MQVCTYLLMLFLVVCAVAVTLSKKPVSYTQLTLPTTPYV